MDEQLYDATKLDERWERIVSIQFKEVPSNLIAEVRAILDRLLSTTEISRRYVSPFTGKRYGLMDKVIDEGIPYVIESKVTQQKHR